MNALLSQSVALETIFGAPGAAESPALIASRVVRCANELVHHGEYARAAAIAERALETMGDAFAPRELLRVGLARAWALLKLDRVPEAADALHVLREACGDAVGAESVEWGMLRAFEAGVLWRRNDAAEAVRRLAALRAELALRPDSAASALCALELMAALDFAGDRAAARDAALEAWVVSRRIGHAHWQALAASYRARFDRQECRWAAAEEALAESLAGFRAAGNRHHAGYVMRMQGIVAWKRGRLAEALELADQVRGEAMVAGLHTEFWEASLLRALALTHQGRHDEARATLLAEPDWRVPSRFSRRSLLTAEYLGDLDLEQGDARAALQRFEPALAQAMALVPRGDVVAELRRRIAECRLALGEPERALAEAEAALAHCREIRERYDAAATHRVIALARAALGDHAGARRAFEDGFDAFEAIETPYEWGKLWLAHGDWLALAGAGAFRNPSAALEAYAAAADHFARGGAVVRLAEARERLSALQARMRDEGEAYAPTFGRARPARRPRQGADLQRRAQWAYEAYGLVTRSAPLLEMLEEIGGVATSDLPVLVLGESGTGKELVAQGVHRLSGRTGAFVAINCSAVPEAMLEGEFFGYMKGAFTNAVADKPGLFEIAHEGTVFLDEIGEMSPDLQAKLLRFLETGMLRRVGATHDQHVETRIVAATNRDRASLQAGRAFRSDLYYRLAHAVYELPPLRARGDDLELLVDHFLDASNRSHGKQATFAAAARAKLVRHSWPGNVRELQAVVRKLVVAGGPGAVFTPRDLPPLDGVDTGADFLGETLANEKKRIVAALEQAHFVKTEAARILRISRTTLIGKMKRMGIEG